MIEPQHMLVEERGLESQIKRLKVLLMGKGFEQLNSIIEELNAIKTSIKFENDRILKDKLKTKQLIRNEKMTKYKIVKTQGTKESVGAFMVFDQDGEDCFDAKGNNAWDNLQEAEEVKQQTNQERK